MINSLKAFSGWPVRGRDGDLGSVKDFFLDDRDWTLACMAAGLGAWPATGRSVLIPAAAFRFPRNREARAFEVDLTREHIAHSPDTDFSGPVRRSQLGPLLRYYREPTEENREHVYAAAPEVPGAEDRLVSLRALARCRLRTPDGRSSGTLHDVLFEDEDGSIRYLIVEMGGVGGKKIIMSPGWVESVETVYSEVRTWMPQGWLEHAPVYHARTPATPARFGGAPGVTP